MGLVSYDRDWKETARYHAQSGGWVSKDFIDVYNVEMSQQSDGPEQILAAIPQFRPFAAHPRVLGALVLEPRFDRLDGLNIFRMEVEYSTEIEAMQDPLQIAAIITDDSVAREIIRFTDANGKVKCNTAGDLFDDPAPVVTVYDTVYKVQKNLPTKRPGWFRDYANCVNSDAVTIRGELCEPGTLLYVPGSTGADQMGGPNGNKPFCGASFELHYRASGWKTVVFNRGWNELLQVPLAGKLKSQDDTVLLAQLAAGQLPNDQVLGIIKGKLYVRRKIYVGVARENPTDPQPLDKNGRYIPVPTSSNIVFLDFDDYDKVPFNGILPLS